MRTPLRVAAAQPPCTAGDVAANAVQAAGARLVVFPELSLTGYELEPVPHPLPYAGGQLLAEHLGAAVLDKGRVAPTQEVVTAVSGASCGLELPAGGPALFLASLQPTAEGDLRPGQLAGSLCGGTRAGAAVPADFGAGEAPEAGPSGAPGTPSTPPAASPPADDGGFPPGAVVGLTVAIGAGLLAAAALLRS